MSDPNAVRQFYDSLAACHAAARKQLGRPLTLAEKILFAHLAPGQELPQRDGSYVNLRPDRIAMQDATAQMALLQFALAGREQVAVPSTVHCDHLIQARSGCDSDLAAANDVNAEVYAFLKSASAKYGIGFWEPGAGIIHQVVLENYAFPGGMMIGTDSHTPNAGGLGMAAIGVGGADAMEVMAGLPFNIRWPQLIGIRLTGALSGWASPKDVILKVCEILTVKGGTGHIIEYFGPGCESISCTGKGTICNMGAEVGATTSLFPFDERMAEYLEATGRGELAQLAREHGTELRADPEVEAKAEEIFDRVIEIDLSALEPLIVGPHSPDLARPVTGLGAEARQAGWPLELNAALIGSCTNSSYEDMERAAAVARQATALGLRATVPFYITPGSETIDRTIRRDGQMAALEAIGGIVLANACGPCIGQWRRDDISDGEANSIVSSYNRNFSGRNDGNHATLSFLTSPEVVTAMALAGRLDFDPLRDSLPAGNGKQVRLAPPTGSDLPAGGFATSLDGYVAPLTDGSAVELEVDPASERLQLLEPFVPPTADDMQGLLVLAKIEGKCTTDHISPAGPWLRYRGHLDHISGNTYIGASNSFTDERGMAISALTGEQAPLPEVARAYHAAEQGWVVVADTNYGEGSSREHAAMSPRFLGCRAIIARSFARIAEANLKKQGVLALAFETAADWELVRADDHLTIKGLDALAPGSRLTIGIVHADGTRDEFSCHHSLSEQQVEWFRAGSALNYLRQQS
ncbi:MAG: aconitate hydratase [Methanobacteriota archaeon]|uniref:aconitate hydratase n=1 Tax=Marine Group III euryarchaeote TaxID=2173149 RepID=A0A7C8DGJ8_9ARCH|nr:MAG: aconitate hydratase [Euryarchaeota archaeon]HIG63570.1 aconitate hydratase [Marine Group III euryarchaeote]